MQRQNYPYLHCVFHTKAAPARAVHWTDSGSGGDAGAVVGGGGCRGGAHGLWRRRHGGFYRELRGRRAWPARVAAARGLRREARAAVTWGLRWEATGAAVARPVWVAAAPVLWLRRGLRGGHHRKRRGQDGKYKNSRSNQA
ncbi:hypothetical protein GUJ93_ZPchr0009g1763 [Zizania palustris]|uniref:Uncharacterized protein n=1 Tax=Zizania palustris TaxID=103762 RepID=A0A8J5VL66_ZIZPA|nr:hypothetical protein GUJ93_ZPchr0009g1763 [Zizania palustris]